MGQRLAEPGIGTSADAAHMNACATLLIVIVLPLLAQNAEISGLITDPSGLAVPGARVVVQSVDTGATRTVSSNQRGEYSVPALLPSPYNITVEANGFKTIHQNGVVVEVDQRARLDFALTVGSNTESITVQGIAPLLNTSDASVSTVIGNRFVENLPLNGRSFSSLIELTPGVVLTESNFYEQGQFSVNGQRPDANYFLVDGVGANLGTSASNLGQGGAGQLPATSAFGGTSNLVSLDALEEFRIQTSTFAPEYGRTPGAQISVVTKSGTNTFHGTAFEYFRNDKLDANDWFANRNGLARPELRQNDFGGVLGGPIKRDKLFFFGSYEGVRVRQPHDQAAYAGTLISVEYETQPPAVFDRQTTKDAVQPPQFLWPVASSVGNADKAISSSSVKIEQTYATADRHHNQMEPHATTAVWGADGTLTLYETTQHIFGTRELVSMVLGVPQEKINVVCQFLGGGFGGKGYVWPHTLIAALAAKVLDRPVHVQLTRAQMYSMAGHQPASIQVIRIGAERNGKLNGIRHDSVTPTSMFDNYIEYAALCPRSLWAASGGIATNHKIVHVNRNTPTPLRAPHEALGHFALESALDELAYATGVDPIKIRLLNDTEIDPESGRPFSTRAMRKCLLEGAARFGWEKRTPDPCSVRDGRYLIGQGMAGAIYTHWRWPAQARVTLRNDGSGLVEAGTHDLGTGTYTVLQQIAADTLGLAREKIGVRIGDTRLPKSHGSIGSATLANAGASVMLAAKDARDKAIALARTGRFAPFADAQTDDEIVATTGKLVVPRRNQEIAYDELLVRNDLSSLTGEGNYDPSPEGPKATFSFSAVFAEVRVDPDLGLVRLTRFVGAYDCGRVINPKTARSQAIGGIIWGVGQALNGAIGN